LLLSTVA